jgi:uncharacterized protein DUF4037
LGNLIAMPRAFVPSLRLNKAFYCEIVAPLVEPYPHAAALLGWGSDVLGFDSERSTDHGWGPRLQIFVAEADVDAVRVRVDTGLPASFRGLPVRFGWDDVAPRHWVSVVPLGTWLIRHLGIDPRCGMTTRDWLTVPQQLLLGVVRGAVYADPTGELTTLRSHLRWYPRDVWLWVLGAQWHRIAQEEAFVGRASEAGDELGSRLLAGRLVRELMCLVFLLQREYRPYSKWFGIAFASLPGAAVLRPVLERAVAAGQYAAREAALVEAYEAVAAQHNAVGLTTEVDPRTRDYHGRPFRVLMADRFADACTAAIRDTWLRGLPLVGTVDQFVDSTDVMRPSERPQHLRPFYDRIIGSTP